MLVYEKSDKHLYGNLEGTIPTNEDVQLTYKDAEGSTLTLSRSDTYLDDGKGGIIRKSDNKAVNVFVGNTQIIGSIISPEGEVIIDGIPDAMYQSGGDYTSIGFVFESEPTTLANIKVGTTFTVEINNQLYDFTIVVVNTESGNRNYASAQSATVQSFSLSDTIEGFACQMNIEGDVTPITNFKVIQTSDYEEEITPDPTPEPEPKSMTSIEVTTMPTKTNYSVGEQLDLTGMVVTAHFNDGTDEVLTEDIQTYPVDGAILTSSNTRVRVYYFELEDYIDLSIS